MNDEITKSIGGGYCRSTRIDALKLFAAFLVVCIHTPVPGDAAAYYMTLTRIGVPVFLMISGFFYKEDRAVNQIKRISILLLISNGMYFVVHVIIAAHTHTIGEYFASTFTIDKAIDFIVFNESPIHYHLWYLGTVLYVVIIIKIVRKRVYRILFCLTPFLLLGDLLLGKYSILIFHREFSYVLVRNWIFVGLPYFLIGVWLSNHWEGISRKYNLRANIIMIIIFCMTSFMERWMLVLNGCNAARDHYLSSTFLAVSVFLLFALNGKETETLFSRFGRKYSTWIYIFHPLFIIILDGIASKMGVTNQYLNIRPLLVFLITTGFLLIWDKCIMHIKKRGTHK